MNWYIAKIVFSISIENVFQTPQFEEQLRLIYAEDPEEALFKGRLIGEKESDEFMNDKKNLVKWQFIDIAELIPLPELKDGMELYGRIHETDEATAYIRFVQQKAAWLQSNNISYA